MGNRVQKPLSAYGWRGVEPIAPKWCNSCSKTKPMGPKDARCEDCARRRKDIEDSLLMPPPVYLGSEHSFTLGHITSSVSHRASERPLAADERRLGWFVLPPFQRGAVWTDDQRARLIESIWLGLPIGTYTYNQAPNFQGPTDLWLIDGQQRIGAILAYVADEFPVFGHRYSELPQVETFGFEMKVFPAMMTKSDDAAQLEDIYNRLAYGGTAHEAKA